MDRRTLLQGMAAIPLTSGVAGRAFGAAQRPRKVVVVGAGIVGAAIAYELSKRGVQVTILEKTAPAAGATGNSFAYLNASTKTDSRPYFMFNWLGMAGWRIWEREPGERLPLQWGGSTYWRETPQDSTKLAATLRTAQDWGYAGFAVDGSALRRLLPTVDNVGDPGGAYFPEEGSVDPAEAVTALLARAARHGAKLICPVEITDIIVRDGQARGVRAKGQNFDADTVVIAAGLGSEALAATAGAKVPVSASPGILLHTQPQPRLLERVVFGPRSTFRQQLDGRILASISGHEGAAPAGADAAEFGRIIQSNASLYLPQLNNAAIERVTVGQRVIPADSFPIVGFTPRLRQLYVAATHSGITLAPAIGRLATAEIIDGVSPDILSPFRPSRFA